MAVHYTCDLCGQPLKEHETEIIAFMKKEEVWTGFEKKIDDMFKEIHEICPSCKSFIEAIFKLKKDRMLELEKLLEKQYIIKPDEIERNKLLSKFYNELTKKGVSYGEIQRLVLSGWGAGDSFKLTFGAEETAAINYASDIAAAIDAALEALVAIAAGEIFVTRIDVNTYDITFSGSFLGIDVSTLSVTSVVGCTGSVTVVCEARQRSGSISFGVDVFKCAGTGDDANDAGMDWYLYLAKGPTNEHYTMTLSSYAAGDTFTMTVDGETTGTITCDVNENTTAGLIQAALEALPGLSPGDVTVFCYGTGGNAYYKFEFEGNKANTPVLLSFTNISGLSAVLTRVVVGGSINTLLYVGLSEGYSAGWFSKGIVQTYSSTASRSVDANNYIYHTSMYANVNYQFSTYFQNGYGVYFYPVLNHSGFSYQIKLTNNFLMISTIVGNVEDFMFAGLVDSLVDDAVGDAKPLIFISDTAPSASYGNSSMLTCPGVTSGTIESLGKVSIYPWTLSHLAGTNAANDMDFWQGQVAAVNRVLVRHGVSTAVFYLYGANRGLLKSDILCVWTGGTVNIGDKFYVDSDATPQEWRVMGSQDNIYLITRPV